ncbi:VOC family protein [Devosia ginsengisoli]|uniref:VOC family protein n=1 Tax=Devosia ginsengisoli TaxID=400770 RepID=UPI0026EFEBC3|nr:VOC family protein [Devosia ginsengisoli]MCR6671866.1 VOC family protein [Devosia ginsengisoli]
MKYWHAMLRISNVEDSLRFFCEGLGLVETRRQEVEAGRYTNIFVNTPGDTSAQIELTYNWDPQDYPGGRNFGHLAFWVDDVYAICQHLTEMGYTINRPPRDGYMAFVRSPDGISIELLQRGERLAPQEPWASQPNTGSW